VGLTVDQNTVAEKRKKGTRVTAEVRFSHWLGSLLS
jgi:hypothetical protein